MRFLARLTPLFALAACAFAGQQSSIPTPAGTLPTLPQVTRVVLTDPVSGARLGEVQRTDSVAALVNLYNHLTVGWTQGAAPSPEIDATFYQNSVPVARLALASGAFETQSGGHLFRRSASPNEALAFVQLAGVPIKHGSGAAHLSLPQGGNAQPPD